MNEANLAHAAKLLALAEAYGTATQSLPRMLLYAHPDSKEECLALMRAIGGKFTEERSYNTVHFRSEKIEGFSIGIDTDKIYRRVTPVYDDEPLLSVLLEAKTHEIH